MSKHIIDFPDGVEWGVVTCRTEDGFYTRDFDSLEELNSDYIDEHFRDLQDTAYQKGLEEGKKQAKVQAHLDVCHDIERVAHGNYQQGLEDAWEAAKKIFGYEIDGGIPIDEVGRVFGYSEDATFCTADIFRHNTVSEAIAKLKAYEEKQDDEIEVGDTVNLKNASLDKENGLVTKIWNNDYCYIVWSDGSGGSWEKNMLVKTGKHIDIASILEDMRND